MCEYCEKMRDNVLKDIIINKPINSSLFIDSEHSRIFWRMNHYLKTETLVACTDINYCPMCGRKLKEAK